MEFEKKKFTFQNKNGEKLFTDVRLHKNNKKNPLFIFAHGFKGFKDWGGFPFMLDKITNAGITTVAFNFSHNGTGDSPETMSDFTRLEMFANNTFSIELDDLNTVISSIIEIADELNADTSNITLCGHSRGGGTAILQTANDNRINKLITLASVCNFDRYSDRQKSLWREKGFMEALNTRTNQMMRMNVTLLDDIENNFDKLDIESAASKIEVPWLIIHGTEDLAVDISHAETLKAHNSNDSTKLMIIENTGHTFGVVHPFEGSNKIFDDVITSMIEFIKL